MTFRHAAFALTAEDAAPEESQLVTMRVDGQLLGVHVRQVRDVLRGARISCIPLAPPEVIGSMNLRGRIVTAIDMRTRLNLQPLASDAPMFVVVERKGEYFSLRVDSVGDVLNVPTHQIEKNPSNLAAQWQHVVSGVYRLPAELLLVIDVHALLAAQS